MFYKWSLLGNDHKKEIEMVFNDTGCLIDFTDKAKIDLNLKKYSFKTVSSSFSKLEETLKNIKLNLIKQIGYVVVQTGQDMNIEDYELIQDILNVSNIKVLLIPCQIGRVRLYISLQ